ncbi:hypothetical protein NC653_032384 [Populus alba x Populus x berolinensis]|uniref:Uncharacterized protein n=1 Tax=Populus alba x Populus x berolinensis TaxID=444605 RepID=A0AAD6LRF2_9ROSI|nr:hypothetical protein NC653_032384 [Populus alba x Populus x berolinensis]
MPFHFRSKRVFVKLCLFILDPSNLSRMWTTVIWECYFITYLPFPLRAGIFVLLQVACLFWRMKWITCFFFLTQGF